MTPHYDLKQQEKNNGVLRVGLVVVVGGGSQIFLSYIWGVEYVFPTGWGGVVKMFAYHMKM